MSAIFGGLRLNLFQIYHLTYYRLPKIISQANNCNFVMNIYFEKEFTTHLSELRKKINLII
jgi:ubiquinone biosynthesis protein Coq4